MNQAALKQAGWSDRKISGVWTTTPTGKANIFLYEIEGHIPAKILASGGKKPAEAEPKPAEKPAEPPKVSPKGEVTAGLISDGWMPAGGGDDGTAHFKKDGLHVSVDKNGGWRLLDLKKPGGDVIAQGRAGSAGEIAGKAEAYKAPAKPVPAEHQGHHGASQGRRVRVRAPAGTRREVRGEARRRRGRRDAAEPPRPRSRRAGRAAP